MERIGVGFSGGMSPQDIVECVKVAEELGYESAWVAEGHGGDQFSILTACAVATDRIKLGTSITSVYVRTAPTIAMAAASVDYFSKGRFILGLGTSHKVQVEPEHGLEFTRPVQRLRECVDIVRAILKDSDVNYHGEIYNIDRFDLWFEPLRREIPIYVAAVFPKMLEVCGEISQGAILTWCTLEHAETAARHVGIGARKAGRAPGDVEVASLLPCAVSDDREAARDLMRQPIASYAGRFPRYRKLMIDAGFPEEIENVRVAWQEGRVQEALDLVPGGLIDKIGLVGTADECRQKLAGYRKAGITLPIVSPRLMGEGAKEQALEIIRTCAPA
ncbi:MAG: LLM class flavin-dependent oxidoreductase [Chloroflexi bacterium]|nr:LLM class flavin-dependent oxidoreductase [Chloroflexota bacterium]